MANITKAELQEKYDDAQREIARLIKRDEEFRSDVVLAASQAAFEHDLCKVLDETLAKCGIEVPTVEVIVESATVYRIPLTVASRVGFLDESTDLKATVESALEYGVLNDEWNEDEEDFGIPGGLDKDSPIVTNVTIKQPTAA